MEQCVSLGERALETRQSIAQIQALVYHRRPAYVPSELRNPQGMKYSVKAASDRPTLAGYYVGGIHNYRYTIMLAGCRIVTPPRNRRFEVSLRAIGDRSGSNDILALLSTSDPLGPLHDGMTGA